MANKNTIKCDQCGKELSETEEVYFEQGLTYNACSLRCYALLKCNVSCQSVKNRLANNEEDQDNEIIFS